MSRKTLMWAIAALLGIALTAVVAWSASQLTSQHIGLAGEPLSAGSLAPSATSVSRPEPRVTSVTKSGSAPPSARPARTQTATEPQAASAPARVATPAQPPAATQPAGANAGTQTKAPVPTARSRGEDDTKDRGPSTSSPRPSTAGATPDD